MQSIFGSSKPPAITPPPQAPSASSNQAELDAAAAAERKARGRAATILTSGMGDTSLNSGASRVLLA